MRITVFSVALATMFSGCSALTGFGEYVFEGWPEGGPVDAGDALADRDADPDSTVPAPDADATVSRDGTVNDPADGMVLPVDADAPDADTGTTNDSGTEDTGPTDADADAGIEPDAGLDPDTGPVDSGPTDTGPAPDAFTDPDTGATDAGPADTGPADSGPPPCVTETGIGCCDGTNDQVYNDRLLPNAMVGCRGSETQCTAETLCAPGWHLCTPIEFENRGGASYIPEFDVWIAGCVRHADCSTIEPIPMSGPWIWVAEENICAGTCESRIPGTDLPRDLNWGFTCEAPILNLSETDCAMGVIGTGPRKYTIGSSGECGYHQVQGAHIPEGAACCR